MQALFLEENKSCEVFRKAMAGVLLVRHIGEKFNGLISTSLLCFDAGSNQGVEAVESMTVIAGTRLGNALEYQLQTFGL